ncbi:MAG TPA: Maf family protein [Pseudomonadales bacterium]|jgi:septum formation protein
MSRPICLASASPRRKALLAQIGVSCQQRSTDIDERPLSGEDPVAYVQRLARAKAEACLMQDEAVLAEQVIVAADTAVVMDGCILGKPTDEQDAMRMLDRLSGRWHRVHTGVAVLSPHGMSLCCVTTRVRMNSISRSDAQAYWASGEPLDKAGAYGIQGLGAVFIERIEGSYSAVVGLPLCETAALLVQHGVMTFQERAGGH